MQVPASETKHVQQLAYHFTRLGNNNSNDNSIITGGTNGSGSSNGQKTFLLNQRDDHGLTNGTTLWLGGQVLSHYLASILLDDDHHRSDKSSNTNTNNEQRGRRRRRKRAIELGSGIGLTALVLYSMGWDVCATDVEPVLTSVLRPNILMNSNSNSNSTATGGGSSRGGVSSAEPWEEDEDEDDGDGPPISRIECRELDWTVPPEEWTWEDPVVIASHKPSSVHHSPEEGENERGKGVSTTRTRTTGTRTMSPPYDLIVTADTLYTPDLVAPLFRTIQHLARLSPNSPNPPAASSSPSPIKGNDLPNARRPSRPVSTKYSCPIYVAVERRDPLLMDAAYEECQTVWGFKVERVRGVKIRKALEKAGVQWKRKTRHHRGNGSEEEEEAGGGGEEEELPWDGVEIWKMRLPLSSSLSKS